MKWIFFTALAAGLLLWACSKSETNPFFADYGTPFETPDFSKISEADYLPAMKEGIRQHKAEIEAIATSGEAASFTNTIEAIEKSGALLDRSANLFFAMNSANTNDNLQAIAREVSPLLSQHNDDIYLNDALFQRIKSIYDQRESLDLSTEQQTVLDKYYKDFVRSGANLDEAGKVRLREINKELSLLTLQFGENVLKEDNAYALVIEKKEELAGLPDGVIAGGAEAAKERGMDGKWVFTLHKPSLIPFITYSDIREYRKQMLTAYIERGNNNNELDNKANTARIVELRIEKANLLGYPTHAHFVLEENMAKNPENVYKLLNQIWDAALPMAKAEARELQKLIDADGGDFKLAAWDWWYYAEKLKKAKYDLDESELRPYFQMEKVRQGVFDTATKLFGITFTERSDISKYHPDVTVYEVKNADGSHVGILYTDYYPRASKRGGAWMDAWRKQSNIAGNRVTPLIYNVGNFSKPTADQPSLLSLDEVNTLFHEFGHALHGLLSDCSYPSVSGTSVARDFVETFSQMMENWAMEPEVLKSYAVHYQTGEPIPDELIAKIKNSGHFNQGFATVEYLAASFLDMDWHTLTEAMDIDVIDFENKSMANIGMIPEIVVRYRSPYFRHIFAGGYSAGYYSYIWAEVLDADAFQAFKENGIFDPATAKSLRDNLLSRGGTEDAMVLYKRFRGHEPSIEPLLERRGLK